MALARIKNPEQLKQCKPGELGRIIGLDRIPETRNLRKKLKIISAQGKSRQLNNLLMEQWYEPQSPDTEFMYIDRHQRIYFGGKANLPTKYISRQKLCLSATTEFWVNDTKGLPVMMVIGDLNEKLQNVIHDTIIPRMIQSGLLQSQESIFKTIEDDPTYDTPQCTFVFDREAYHPKLFQKLWDEYRIAIITYRKNVKDEWSQSAFEQCEVTVLEQKIDMQLSETTIELDGCRFREIRRLSNTGHQTSIITNHPAIERDIAAGRMFGRWSQENFFKYMISDYDFDKIVEFGVQEIDEELEIVNPDYRKQTYRIRKLRERIGRLEAKLYPLVERVMNENIDIIPKVSQKQASIIQNINDLKSQLEELIRIRKKHLTE